jgi:hypothetical protein
MPRKRKKPDSLQIIPSENEGENEAYRLFLQTLQAGGTIEEDDNDGDYTEVDSLVEINHIEFNFNYFCEQKICKHLPFQTP